jgi:hypothetical protein
MRRFSPLTLLLAGMLAFPLTACNTELKRAREAVGKKDYQSAAQLYENVIKADPENDEAMREVTQLYCETLKNNFKCTAKVEDLYKKFPNDPKVKGWYKDAMLGSAKSFYFQQQFKEATKTLKEYTSLVKDDGTAFFMLGNITFRLNRTPPFDKNTLMQAVDYLEKAVKYAKPGDTIGLFEEKRESLIHWEAHVQTGTIFEMFIAEEFKAFMKKQGDAPQKAAPKKGKKGKKGKKAAAAEEGSKFEPNKEYFQKAVAAFEAASKVTQPNKEKVWLPFWKLGFLYAQFKGDKAKGVEWMLKGYNLNQTAASVIGNLKMLYDQLAEEAEKAGEKAKQKEYETKSQEFASKMESLQGKR